MIEIKDISGKTKLSIAINEGAKGKFTLMKEDYIILPFSVSEPVQFKLGDYVDLAGVLDESLGGKLAKIYEITDIQKPTYNTSTGGYDYELQMNAYYWKWKNKIFKYTPEHAGSEASWSLTAALDVQLGVFLRNLKALGYTYRGTDFTFSIDSTVENKAVAMTYDNMNLLDALFSMAGEDKWNCDCWITDNVIHFGRCEFGDAVKIERGVEASSVTRSESQGTYATRIYAFGSTKNIPTNYRPTDEQAVINGVVQKRLMLPADTPYIDAYEGMSQEEAIEDVVVFDDVYPRRVGTLSDVHTRTEEVENEDGTTETVTYYRYKDTGLEFKEEYIIEGQELKIRFQSGKLNGMEFGVIFNPTPKDETRGEQLWEIVRNEDYGRPLPDNMMYPANGDEYILSGFDIQLVSDQYIPEAEQELKEKAQKYADKVKKDDGTYPTTLRSDWVHEDLISRTFEFGQRINLVDDTYFENGRISRVLGWEMNLDIPWDSPVYTIGESIPYSRIGEIEDKVDALTYKGQTYTGGGGSGVYVIKLNDSTAPSDSNVFSALRSLATFLRKDIPDSTKHLLSLLGGVLIEKLARFGEFITGVSGGMIDENGDLEMSSGYFRKRLFVPELAYNRITYFKGRAVLSPGGGCKVKSYVKNEDGSYTVTPDLTDADGLSQFKDDILSAFFTTKNEEGKLTGFAQMQFRVTEADYDAKTFKMVNKPGETYEPGEEMVLAQTGNFSDEERQTYILFDTINGNNCITFFDHANTWDPEPAQMPAWFGKKKGMEIAGINCDNYSAVLQNILLTGLIFQIDEITGDSVRVPIDKGEWKDETDYGYYDRVSHNGALWLCVSEEATKEEPGTGNAWLKQVSEGAKGEPGLSVVGGGHWESSKTPYQANTLVSFYNCVFISNVKTSNPPIAIARYKDGSFIRQKNGGYILAGKSADFTVHEDWTMLLDGRELQGKSITFLGSFDKAPSNPAEGNSYYNTTDKCTYVYQNGVWMLMVSDGKDGRDYEYIYTRNNSIGIIPEKPDSKQQDDYVPEGWTDDFLGVSETFQVEWGCKRTKRDGVWSEWSDPAIVHRWSKDGENGADGISIEAVGHWESSKVPYTKNQLVNFSRGTFVALKETSNPPLPIARFKDGSYRRMKDGGYILEGKLADMEVNEDWKMMSWMDNPETLYWLDCPISAFSYTSTGSASPSSVEVTCKKSYKENVSSCSTLWLVARKYNGSWESHVSPVQSTTIAISALAGYTQYVVRAYKTQADANAWNSAYVAERGIGVAQAGKDGTDYEYIFQRTTTNSRPSTPSTSQQDDYVPSGWTDDPQGISETYPYEWASMRTKNDKVWGPFCTPYPFCVLGKQGIQGVNGAFPYDRGVYKSGNSYVWNQNRRDKIIYKIGNTYYNFLVKNYGATVTAAPTSASGDSNWEAMQKFESIVTDTFFADGANIAGLMFKLKGYTSAGIPYGEVQSQNTDGNGTPMLYMNTQTGYFYCSNATVQGAVTATSGKIGGWNINGNNLECSGYNTKILVEASGTRFMRINAEESIMCYIRSDESTGISASVYGSTDSAVGINVLCNSAGKGFAIKSYGNVLLNARQGEHVQVYGLSIQVRKVTASGSLYSNDDFIEFANASAITFNMSTNAVIGKVVYMKKVSTGADVTLVGSFRNPGDVGISTSGRIGDEVSRMFVFDGDYWVQFYCG